MAETNVMQKPRIEKVVVNIGAGESGEKLVKAEKLLEKLTGRKPVRTVSKHKIPAWNLRKKEPIGCKVTLRGKGAVEFLKRGLSAKDNTLQESSFTDDGNFSFGIHECIDIPGMKYDPEIGILGMNLTTTMKKPGYRVKHRRLKKAEIPKKHQVTREEAMQFAKEQFGVKIE